VRADSREHQPSLAGIDIAGKRPEPELGAAGGREEPAFASGLAEAEAVAVILVLGFGLLMLAFRSLLIPAVAAVMNLLAAAASFGVLVAVFQYGWGLRLLNLGQAGPVESFLPVLMLAVLFGLSMDYEVFLVSRIREEWAATGDNHQAVRTGQATTGRVIIAAATIMILVFSAFILSGQQVIGEIGIGLAAAVLLDAFLLRTLLVPAPSSCPH
jgi:putative drug exporter of the RND superfamily